MTYTTVKCINAVDAHICITRESNGGMCSSVIVRWHYTDGRMEEYNNMYDFVVWSCLCDLVRWFGDEAG